MAGANGASSGANGVAGAKIGTSKVKQGLAQMLKGGVIVSSLFLSSSVRQCMPCSSGRCASVCMVCICRHPLRVHSHISACRM